MGAPRIACLFHTTLRLGCEEAQLVAALQSYVNDWLCPAWGASALVYDPRGPDGGPGDWPLVFADDSDQARALGYHELDGSRPCGFVFVRTSTDAGEPVSVTASHELAELLLDPGCNVAARSPRGRWVGREVCDPVQGTYLTVGGLQLANFVLPSWYGAGQAPYDAAGEVAAPWEVLAGGYVPVWDDEAQSWTSLFGSRAAEEAFARRGAGGRLRRLGRRAALAPPAKPVPPGPRGPAHAGHPGATQGGAVTAAGPAAAAAAPR